MELSDEDRLQALNSLAALEDEAADDSEGIPTNPYGAAFGAAAAAPLRKAAEPVEVGEFNSRALGDSTTEAAGAEAAMGYPAELWSKPVQGPEYRPEEKEEAPAAPVDRAPVASGDKEGPDDRVATPPPPSPSEGGMSASGIDRERLRMLEAIANGDDEGRIRQAFDEDRRQAAQDRLSEALVGMARGAPVTFTTQMPSRVSEESALTSRRDKLNALRMQLMRGQGKSGVPDWYYKNLADSRTEANELRRLEMRERSLQNAANRGDKEAQRELERLRLDAQNRKTDIWAKYLGSKRKAGKPKGEALKTLPVSEVDALADADLATEELDRLAAKHGELSMGTAGAKVGNAATKLLGLQGTGSAAYAAERRRVAQSVGKILEGGKLAAGDEIKYERMLPQPGDPPNLVKQKTDGLKKMLQDLKAKRSRALKAAGYKIEGPDAEQPAQARPGKTITVRKGDEQYDIDSSDLQDAIDDGYEVVQ